MTDRIYMVDVFADRAWAGNPLAVVVVDEFPAVEAMQRIAAEINFSETTFLARAPQGGGGHRVRMFTPAREVAFAGHAILGTAWVLRHHVAASTAPQVQLDLVGAHVPVTFETADDGRDVAWLRAPEVGLGKTCPREPVAAALGLAPGDVEAAPPVQVVSAGTAVLVVPLASLDALQRSRLDLKAYAPLAAAGYPPLVYQFCRQTRDPGNDLSARFFFEAHGVREDPATGNGAAFLGAWLFAHGRVPDEGTLLRIEQGHEVRRPSLVRVRVRKAGGVAEVGVGGTVVPTVTGELV